MNDVSRDQGPDGGNSRRLRQVAWFFGLWLASVLALGAVTLLIRSALKP